MIRLFVYFVILAALAYGGMWLVQHPGHIRMDWFGYRVETSAALLVLAIAVAAIVFWIIVRVVLGLPSFMRYAARQRRREKGYAALSRGLVAVGAGDARGASRAASQASRSLTDDPLALMLRAQAARLNGNDQEAVGAFEALAKREDTRIFGLRGLYAEANRRGDDEAARHFAEAAYKAAPLPWSSEAVLEQRASHSEWEKALATVESAVSAKLVDQDTGQRQRAVLETAIAYDKEGTAPDAALSLARSAMKRASDLAPPVVLAARLLSRRGDIRKATKMIEAAWPRCQHPDIAQVYLDVRPGDSTTDRLARAKTLMGITSNDPVSRMTVARAALANTDYATARSAMDPLVGEGKRPTVRMCLLMAEIEEAEHGDIGQWREWLARASRAALDPAWVADGIVYDQWEPVSPTTGKLDAFHWQVPAERLGPAVEAMPPTKLFTNSQSPVLPAENTAPLLKHEPDPIPDELIEPTTSVAAPPPPADAAPLRGQTSLDHAQAKSSVVTSFGTKLSIPKMLEPETTPAVLTEAARAKIASAEVLLAEDRAASIASEQGLPAHGSLDALGTASTPEGESAPVPASTQSPEPSVVLLDDAGRAKAEGEPDLEAPAVDVQQAAKPRRFSIFTSS